MLVLQVVLAALPLVTSAGKKNIKGTQYDLLLLLYLREKQIKQLGDNKMEKFKIAIAQHPKLKMRYFGLYIPYFEKWECLKHV